MCRYLDAAAKVVFIHYGGKVGDVIRVLKNHIIRHEFINKALDSGIFKEDDDEIVDLISLDDTNNKDEIVGTRESLISGIMDRISVLNKDIYIRQMLKADVNYEQNFLKWIDQGKTILIRLPESEFTNKQVKDTIVTYFMGRIWLAALRRSGGRITHIVTDEIHQVPTAARLVSGVVTEGRKFGIDFYFTIHYLKQFKELHDAIKSSGCSYKLLAGIEKENLKALEQEIAPFTIEEGLSMKPFHSLNIINYGNQYAKFISKLPTPLK